MSIAGANLYFVVYENIVDSASWTFGGSGGVVSRGRRTEGVKVSEIGLPVASS